MHFRLWTVSSSNPTHRTLAFVTRRTSWLTLVSPLTTVLKVQVDRPVQIAVAGVTKPYWFTGIALQLPSFGIIVRVFGEQQDPQ